MVTVVCTKRRVRPVRPFLLFQRPMACWWLRALMFATAVLCLLQVGVSSTGVAADEHRALPSGSSAPESPSAAQPATTSVPTPPPAPTSRSAVRAPEATKEPAGPAIEGSYTVEGSTSVIRVRRLLGDIYHLVSSEGWEGVGILDGAVYRGVFRHRGARDAPNGAVGEHTIDWAAPENPSVQATYVTPRTGQFAQRWRRLPSSEKRAVEKPLRPVTVAPDAAPTPGQRPAFGEYVYVEELPEAVSKVAPIYPNDMKPGGEGTVMVQALVLEDGSVGDVRIVRSVPGLDEAAVACVRQWRFKPAMSKGAPVAVWVAVPVRFGPR
jgi:TonB family protein